MIVKVLLTFDFDPSTNTYKELKSEIYKDKVTVVDNSKPEIQLDDNRYFINTAAMDLLGVAVGDRIDIRYKIVDGVDVPLIGSATSWGDQLGNKITKSQTVSCRGSSNSQLSKFGRVFELEETNDGLFKLVSKDKVVKNEIVEDKNIEVPVSDDLVNDLIEDGNVEEDYNIADIDFDNLINE